jgi:hypothetical protein
MQRRASLLFAGLIAAQAAHSYEEYATALYDVLAPARFLSGLLGLERPAGFLILNFVLNLFGLWCWLARVRPRRGAWRAYAWFWALLEMGNGTAHLLFALVAGGYFPGAATAPLLLGLGAALPLALRADAGRSDPALRRNGDGGGPQAG